MKRILLTLLALGMLLPAGASGRDVRLTVQNNDFSTTLQASGGRIRAVSFYDKASKRELLAPDGEPFFELCINGRIVTSEMPLWRYVSTSEQRLCNEGVVMSYTFQGQGAMRGLRLTLDREYFPDGMFLRERLRLQAGRNGQFRLTNHSQRNHFIFPRYTFTDGGSAPATEMRMGSYGLEVLPEYDALAAPDRRSTRNLATCHMFHPRDISHPLSERDSCEVKGPFLLVPTLSHQLLFSYEHASQDRSYMTLRPQTADAGLEDASQGVKGDSDLVTDDDLWFISMRATGQRDHRTVGWHIRRGGYLDGEPIPTQTPYETVWSTLSALAPDEQPADAIRKYLLHRITEHPLSRQQHFYYNTWGMQRDAAPHMREVFTQERIAREIALAAETGVDIFIFDDGWQQTMGVWEAHKERLPRGLKPLVDSLRRHKIIPGIWLSLMGIDPASERARQHPEWIIRDRRGEPYAAQWDFPAFDIVGDFYDYILADLKRLCDEGIRFFKWDAINTFNSAQPGLGHGDDRHTRKERIDRYNYLVPFYVTRLMRDLRTYCPDAVVEIDLTEPERALIGLQTLQEGKFFWMNNGASAYGDYTTFRAKSMRNSVNTHARLLPPELFTYAVYPHNKAPYAAQRYNLNTALQAGHGFWGDLSVTSASDRALLRREVGKARRVLSHVAGRPLHAEGLIGASPEIYLQSAPEKGYALLTAFSGSPVSRTLHIPLDTAQVLGTLNHAFRTDSTGVVLTLQLPAPDDTREAFVVGNDGSCVRVVSSTGWLDELSLADKCLRLRSGSDTQVHILLPPGAHNPICNHSVEFTAEGTLLLRLPAATRAELRWE